MEIFYFLYTFPTPTDRRCLTGCLLSAFCQFFLLEITTIYLKSDNIYVEIERTRTQAFAYV